MTWRKHRSAGRTCLLSLSLNLATTYTKDLQIWNMMNQANWKRKTKLGSRPCTCISYPGRNTLNSGSWLVSMDIDWLSGIDKLDNSPRNVHKAWQRGDDPALVQHTIGIYLPILELICRQLASSMWRAHFWTSTKEQCAMLFWMAPELLNVWSHFIDFHSLFIHIIPWFPPVCTLDLSDPNIISCDLRLTFRSIFTALSAPVDLLKHLAAESRIFVGNPVESGALRCGPAHAAKGAFTNLCVFDIIEILNGSLVVNDVDCKTSKSHQWYCICYNKNKYTRQQYVTKVYLLYVADTTQHVRWTMSFSRLLLQKVDIVLTPIAILDPSGSLEVEWEDVAVVHLFLAFQPAFLSLP